jgi:hypothetical protein
MARANRQQNGRSKVASRTVSKDVAERILKGARKDFLKQRRDLGLTSDRNAPSDAFLRRSTNL